MSERIPDEISQAIKGVGWMKFVAVLGVLGGGAFIAGAVIGLLFLLASPGGLWLIPFPIIAGVFGGFIVWLYYTLWEAADLINQSHTSWKYLVKAVSLLDRFFTVWAVVEMVRFALSLLSTAFTGAFAPVMGAVAFARSNSPKMMKVLAVLSVINSFFTKNVITLVISLIISLPIAFFLWRAASFRERMVGAVDEVRAEDVVGYLSNLRYYFMMYAILIVVVFLLAIASILAVIFGAGSLMT